MQSYRVLDQKIFNFTLYTLHYWREKIWLVIFLLVFFNELDYSS